MHLKLHHAMLLALAMLPSLATAASNRQSAPGGWSAEAEATQTMSYDSNPLRTAGNGEDLFGSTTSPELTLRYKTPLSVLESNTKIDLNAFNHARYNSTDIHQKFMVGTNNERWATGLQASFDRDTTRTSELTNYALNLPKVDRTKLGVSPRLIFRQNSTNSFGINTSFADVTYNNNSYVDYRTYGATPYYERRIDPYNFVSVGLSAHGYETTSNSKLTSASYGPEFGWTNNITPRLTSRITAGAEATRKTGANAGSDRNTWNYVFSGSLKYAGEVDTFDLNATRAREPFGNGTETLLTSVSIKERHNINQRFAVRANAGYQSADYSTEPGINLDSGINSGAGFSYNISNDLELTGDYKFRYENLTNVTDNVEQHSVMLGFNYHPSWSRN